MDQKNVYLHTKLCKIARAKIKRLRQTSKQLAKCQTWIFSFGLKITQICTHQHPHPRTSISFTHVAHRWNNGNGIGNVNIGLAIILYKHPFQLLSLQIHRVQASLCS